MSRYALARGILKALDDRGWDRYDLKQHSGLYLRHIDDLILGKSVGGVSTAISLARAFFPEGANSEVKAWIRLQKETRRRQ